MQRSVINFPFKIERGWSEITGIVKFSDAHILLEIESTFLLVFKDIKEIRLALADILDVKFRKGFFKNWGQIEIRVNSLAKLHELPNRDGKIILKLQRDDFKRAREAIERLQKDLNEFHESLPPTQMPVSRLFNDED
ncbi:MAG: hypothetical protein WA584_10865 [Pyrinomonadaceae bacterium]